MLTNSDASLILCCLSASFFASDAIIIASSIAFCLSCSSLAFFCKCLLRDLVPGIYLRGFIPPICCYNSKYFFLYFKYFCL